MIPYQKILTLVALLTLCLAGVGAQNIWDAAHLATAKEHLHEPAYADAYGRLLADADSLLSAEPLSVMTKPKVAASGDKHDYLSQARYFWPDPTKPDGLPYVQRDGESNPELLLLDRPKLSAMATAVTTLSLAYYFSADERYAAKATEQLRVWFLRKQTRMNPNLNYAQMVPGQNGGRGRCYGIIDAYSLVEMLDAVQLLEASRAFTAKDARGLRQWFAQFLDWLLTSDLGRDEQRATNNHGTAYDVQVMAYALYTDNRAVAQQTLADFAHRRIDTQIEADGSQPLELDRTLAYHYSVYNLTHLIDAFLMAHHAGIDVGTDSREAFQKVQRALDFLTPYLGKTVEAWPYRQMSQWAESQQQLAHELYRAWLIDQSRTDYLQRYRRHATQGDGSRFALLYTKNTLADHAFADASRQLRFAMTCTDAELPKGRTQYGRRAVSPRSEEPDGSLRLVCSYDWCSGFFPANLWLLYGYTHQEEWRQAADRYTWPIEDAKLHGGTHDLGFMLYTSFGRAYELTGDKRYLDVVLQAVRTLITRYNDTVGAIRSWDHNRDKWQYPVIIDNMINLELLFEATRLTGDSTYYKIAVRHADTTLRNHFRADNSSYHVVSYDPQTGRVEKKNTCQGIADESVWSRGQGWGLYGYTMCYRYTRDTAYLEQARRIADFIFGQPGMPADLIPYWDMSDPTIPEAPRDASAAAVVASGLYELATFVDSGEAARYRHWADTITDNLYAHYRSPVGQHQGFLLLHSVGNHPANDEIDVPIVYADYYYLEAMMRRSQTE